ncbi:hypothetical protein CHU92_09245 [Flavobacterium cyanobacteriorum]|uniref:Putative auto-transporter adhesin head GIN domain-containing protein n=1 Tax=Flavobacterium cyanobacteriorum TaxID=2022802 RepID=A0A255Z5R5_9FLAO|nr:head GIN domain-containing protein [Flavobacterium cyanobacteriorum]OYQ36771.1 hypothetical protein CHU92_09245 [Flavobacterium cyanobacteriorum]
MAYRFRYITIIFLLLQLHAGCGNDMPDCFKNAGAAITYEVPVSDFTTINVSEGIELVVAEGPERKVVIQTGENLKDNISATVTGSELYLKNATSCNWVRDYNTTKIFVTTPLLTKIYSASQFAVMSEGVLHFPHLALQSGLFSETASGTFKVDVDNESLTVEDNQSSYYVISGRTNQLNVSFYSGDARFEGSGLTVGNVYVFHRSSNDILVRPQQEVRGTLYSTGNLVLKSQPLLVDIARLYSGQILYQ